MVKDMQDEAKELLKINVSLHKCKRAKRMIIQELDGSYKVQLGEVSQKATESLLCYPPYNWCRSYFSSRCKSMAIDNNFTESFNA